LITDLEPIWKLWANLKAEVFYKQNLSVKSLGNCKNPGSLRFYIKKEFLHEGSRRRHEEHEGTLKTLTPLHSPFSILNSQFIPAHPFTCSPVHLCSPPSNNLTIIPAFQAKKGLILTREIACAMNKLLTIVFITNAFYGCQKNSVEYTPSKFGFVERIPIFDTIFEVTADFETDIVSLPAQKMSQ